MSDTPQGEGWWEASDGRWYPPESVPGPDPDLTQQWDRGTDPSGPGGFQAPSPSPFEPPSAGGPAAGGPAVGGPPPGLGAPGGPPPGYGAPPGPAPSYGAPSPGIPPGGPPPGFGPPGGQPPAYGAPGAAGYGGVSSAPPKKNSRTAWIILAGIVGVLVLVCGGCVALVGFGANEASQGSGFEFITELGLDFSDGVPATGPVSCEVTGIQDDGSDDYAVDALVTNASGVTSHYRVEYDLFGPGQDYIGSDYGIVSNLAPDESVRDFTVGVVDGVPDWQDVTCTVTQAIRIPAE